MSGTITASGLITASGGIKLSAGGFNQIQMGEIPGGGTRMYSFPVAFSSVPIVVCTVVYAGEGYASVSAMIVAITKTYFQYNVFLSAGVHSEQHVNVNYIAIS